VASDSEDHAGRENRRTAVYRVAVLDVLTIPNHHGEAIQVRINYGVPDEGSLKETDVGVTS